MGLILDARNVHQYLSGSEGRRRLELFRSLGDWSWTRCLRLVEQARFHSAINGLHDDHNRNRVKH